MGSLSSRANEFLTEIASAEERQFAAIGHGADFRYHNYQSSTINHLLHDHRNQGGAGDSNHWRGLAHTRWYDVPWMKDFINSRPRPICSGWDRAPRVRTNSSPHQKLLIFFLAK